MSVEDNAQDLIHDMKVRKDAWVEEHPDDPDMPTLVCAYRDGDMVAQALAMPDRDKMIQCASILCFGCAANEVTMTFETFHSELKDNPITELPWETGEMQFIAREHDGIKKGWVTEAMSLMAYDRNGNHLMATVPFEVDGNQVIWGEEQIFIKDPEKEGQRIDGYVHAAMVQIMAGDTMVDKAKADLGEEGYKLLTQNLGEDQFVHSDIATVKFVLRAGVALASGLSAPSGSRRAERIDVLMRKSLERDGQGFTMHTNSADINN